MTIPNGSQAIIDLRKKGLKPNELILVSLIGPTGESNHTVFANPDAVYDWRWTVGLQVCLMVNEATRRRTKEILLAIGKEHPEQLHIWNVDLYKGVRVSPPLPRVEDIEKPKSQWRWMLDFTAWSERENEKFAWSP